MAQGNSDQPAQPAPVAVLADGWGGDLGESDGAKLARRCRFPVRLLPAAGRLERLVVLLAARSRDLLAGRPYRVVMGVLAVLLAFFALLLFREGWKQLG